MGFGIDCVFARLRSDEGLRAKANGIFTHARWESHLYLLHVLQIAKFFFTSMIVIDQTQ